MSSQFYSKQVIQYDGPGCPVNGDILGVGVGTFNISCSGRGDCINNRCICHPGWIGASDYYSLEGVDCQNPRYFEQILWSLTAITWLKLMFNNWTILQYQRGLYRMKRDAFKAKGKEIPESDYWPIVFLSLCFFLGCPSTIITAILKAATNQITGVDIPLTIFFSISSTLILSLSSKCEIQLIHILISPLIEANVVERFISKIKTFYYSISLGLFLGVFICNFLPILLPAIFNGNNGYPRGMIVVAKNIILVIYLSSVGLIYKITTLQAEIILEKCKGSGTLAQAANNAVTKLNEEHKATIKKLTIGGILYGLFCIPQLWGYSTLPTAFILALSSGKGNIIYWYAPSGKIQMDVTPKEKLVQEQPERVENNEQVNVAVVPAASPASVTSQQDQPMSQVMSMDVSEYDSSYQQ